jgi:hypothetical protein
MRVAVLNACAGARGNEIDLFSSTASVLVRHGTPAVVSMQYEITDTAAIEFSRSFYEALADGEPVDTALAEARKGVSMAIPGSLEWGTPVLYTHAADGVLFRVAREETAPSASAPIQQATISLCFSAADEESARALVASLRARDVDAALLPAPAAGKPWDPAVERTLAGSRALVLLLGPGDDAPWKRDEMRTLLERRNLDPAFHVVPVLLPGARLPDLGSLPGFLAPLRWIDLRAGLDDEAGLRDLAAELSGSTRHETIAPLVETVPFRGLEVFDEEHAQFFFGREALTQQLVERLRADRFLAVIGPSGSGKSSVVRAGLVPQLRDGALPHSESWSIVVMKPGAHPLESLAARLAPHVGGTDNPLAVRDTILATLLQNDRGLHATVETALASAPGDRRVVLVVDQFEEVFTLCRDDAERARFVATLLQASSVPGGQTIVVLTMRADFFGRAATIAGLAARMGERDVLVGPMERDELRRAIVEPARRVGLRYEEGLVDTILAELRGEAGALPLLQHTLLELWEGRQDGWLTEERYREIGGVQGAIAKRAETVYAALTPAQQTAARRILLRLIEPGAGGEVTRRRATMAELRPAGSDPSDVDEIVQKLVDARLITTSRDETGEIVDLAHEALIRGWPRYQSWTEENRAGLRVHRRLTDSTAEWTAAQRDPSYLFRGARLQEAVTWAAQNPDEPNEAEGDFLAASVAARAVEERARSRRRRLMVGAGAGAFAVVAALGLVAASGWSTAEQQRVKSDAQGLSATGARDALTNPTMGLAKAAEGLSLARIAGLPTDAFRSTVEQLLASGRSDIFARDVKRLIPSPDGRYSIVDMADGPGTLLRASDGSLVAELAGPVAEVEFGRPEDGVFGVKYESGLAELRRFSDGGPVQLAEPVLRFEFPRDPIARVLVVRYGTLGPNAEVQPGKTPQEIRSTTDGELIRPAGGPGGPRIEVPGPDIGPGTMELPGSNIGRMVLWSADGHQELIRTTDGSVVARVSGFGEPYAFDPGGTMFGTFDLTGQCSLWRASDGRLLSDGARPIDQGNGAVSQCGATALSDDGSIAAVPFADRIEIRRVADWLEVGILPVDTSRIFFSPESGSRTLLAQREDGALELRETAGGQLIGSVRGPLDPGFSYFMSPFSPNGKFVALVIGGERMLYRTDTWERIDVPADPAPVEPDEQSGPVQTAVIFSSDSDYAIFGDFFEQRGELIQLGDDSPKLLGYFWLRFWPGVAGGPVIASRIDGTKNDARPGIVEVESFDEVTYSPGDAPRFGIVNRSQFAGMFGDAVPPSELVIREGGVISLNGAVLPESFTEEFVRFSKDTDTSAFVVRYSDERSEVWDGSGKPRLLASLGLGVSSSQFDDTGDHLVVQYSSGEAYLVDLQVLRGLPSDLAALSDDDLIALVCATVGIEGRAEAPQSCN